MILLKKKKIGDWYRERTTAAVGALTAVVVSAVVTAGIGFGAVPPSGTDAAGREYQLPLARAPKLLVRWSVQGLPQLGRAWREDQYFLARAGLLEPFLARAWGIVLISGVVGAGMYLILRPNGELVRYGARHIRGRILREDRDAVRDSARYFVKEMQRPGNGPGLFLAPGVQMDRMRETEGFLLVGAPGSGKTVYFRFLLSQILARSKAMVEMLHQGVPVDKLPMLPDKIIALDVKGDQTERWPDDSFYLFAPHDTGLRTKPDGTSVRIGYAWDIGADVVGLPAARDFAARTVKATDEPVWGEAARAIVTGMIHGLQQRDGTAWGWRDLYDVAVMEAKPLRAFLKEFYPPAAKFVVLAKDNPTRTTSSYLANIDTGLFPMVEAMAAAWGDYPQEARLSLRGWILDPNPERRTLILQRSGEVGEISASWMRAVIFCMAVFANSPALAEDDRRRIWFVNDEQKQVAAKDDGFLQVIEVGRSKGMCTVVGVQVGKQLEEAWSAAELETLEAMVRNKLIFRLAPSSYADYLSEKIVGSSDWIRADVSKSYAEKSSTSVGYRPERELVVLPSYFDERLGAQKKGVLTLFVGAKYVSRLLIPYPTSWKKRRAGTMPAPWVSDNSFKFNQHSGDAEEETPAVTAQPPTIPVPTGAVRPGLVPGGATITARGSGFSGLAALEILMPNGGRGPAQGNVGASGAPGNATDDGDDDDEE